MFLGMVMYANEVEQRKKKNYLRWKINYNINAIMIDGNKKRNCEGGFWTS